MWASKAVTVTAPAAAARPSPATARRRENTAAQRGRQRHDRGKFTNTYHNHLRVDEIGLSV